MITNLSLTPTLCLKLLRMREFVIGEEGYRYRGYGEFSVSNFESLELEFGQYIQYSYISF